MIWQEKTQASKCFKEFRGLLLLFYGIKSMPQKCLSKKGGKGYVQLPSHTKSAVMCILRTCVCNNKNDHPRMKGMRKAPPPRVLLSVWVKQQLVGQSTSHKMLQKNGGGGQRLVTTSVKNTIEKQAEEECHPNDCHMVPQEEVTAKVSLRATSDIWRQRQEQGEGYKQIYKHICNYICRSRHPKHTLKFLIAHQSSHQGMLSHTKLQWIKTPTEEHLSLRRAEAV